MWPNQFKILGILQCIKIMMNKFFSPSPLWQNNAIAILRIIVGLMLVYHGWEIFDKEVMTGYTTWDSFKASSAPAVMVYLGKASELVAGIFLTLGLFTRVACVIMICTFMYITFFVGNGKFWYQDQHPFMFVLMALVFIATGPGNFNGDALLFGKENRN
jgi:putative oxidoreductase